MTRQLTTDEAAATESFSETWPLALRSSGLHLFILAGVCFLLAAGSGLLSALATTTGVAWHDLPLQLLRPLHTLFSLSGTLAGLLGMTTAIAARVEPEVQAEAVGSPVVLLSLFTVGAAISIATGHGSGREYITWHPAVSVLLLAAIASSAFRLLRLRAALARYAPEGTWLIGTGYAFILLGLAESHLWLWPWISQDGVRDLTVQWHGVDLLFAGMNAALYGAGAMLVSVRQTPLRGLPLYALAAFSLLFTFGHHHYVSPQPEFLKTLAVLASLLAIVSFLRHVRGVRGAVSPVETIPAWHIPLAAVQVWTLVATGSGILLAIPPVNTLFHGTYAIVIHAMGSMIGVLFMLVITGALVVVGASASLQRVRTGVALVNGSLASLWLYLVALGAYEGWARVSMDPLIVSQQLRPWLGGFVLLGGVLLVGISLLSLELIKASRRALRQAADEQPIPRPQTEPLGPTTPA